MRSYWVAIGSQAQMVRAKSGVEAAKRLRLWLVTRGVPRTDETPKIVARSGDRLTYVYRWSDGHQAQVTSEWAIH